MKKVAVIGAGIGGLTGALYLAHLGFNVTIFEKNSSLGGKINFFQKAGFYFDTGPSLLTMPFVFDDLFDFLKIDRSEYLTFESVDPICRYFFHDGSTLVTFSNVDKMIFEIEKFSPGSGKNYRSFYNYSKEIYDSAAPIFLFSPFHEIRKLLKFKNLPFLFKIRKIDPFRTVHQAIAAHFNDFRLIQLFDRYCTYNGSDPFRAPATLNIIPYVEYGLGGFYIKGGMYKLVNALEKLAKQLGITIYTDTPVDKINHLNGNVEGVTARNNFIKFDYVLCNADVVYAHKELIHGFEKQTNKLGSLEPSLSGLVFLWSVRGEFDYLKHHNIFFSSNYFSEFKEIFQNLQPARDPTIYISVTSKKDKSHVPKGCENWFVLVNMPYLVADQNLRDAIEPARNAIFSRLLKNGIDIKNKIEYEQIYSPYYFENTYKSNRGSIYGISSNTRQSAFRRPANRCAYIRGLYFAGGACHPGGGVPLVALSGKIAALLIAENAGVL